MQGLKIGIGGRHFATQLADLFGIDLLEIEILPKEKVKGNLANMPRGAKQNRPHVCEIRKDDYPNV